MTIGLLILALLMTCYICNAVSGPELNLYALSSVENKTINGLNIDIDIECKSSFSLLCEINPYSDSATWEINGNIVASCVFTSCTIYPPFPTNHNFSMNTSTGEFKMTISQVTFDTNGNTYKCDDGQTARSVKGVVKEFPTDDTLSLDTSEDKRTTVTTGCVYPKNETDLLFDWFISETKINPEKEPLPKKSEKSSVFDCVTSSCVGLQTAYFNNTVEFDVFGEGDSYYICVKVIHIDAASRPAEICSDEKFILKEKACEEYNTVCSLGIVMVILLVIDLILLGIFVMLTCCGPNDSLLKWISGKGEEEESKHHLKCACSILPITVMLAGFIVFVIYFPHCYHDSCFCCQLFKGIGIAFIVYFAIRFSLGTIILVIGITFCDSHEKGLWYTSMDIFVCTIFFLPPLCNGIIALCCWVGISCKEEDKEDDYKEMEITNGYNKSRTKDERKKEQGRKTEVERRKEVGREKEIEKINEEYKKTSEQTRKELEEKQKYTFPNPEAKSVVPIKVEYQHKLNDDMIDVTKIKRTGEKLEPKTSSKKGKRMKINAVDILSSDT